MNFNLNEVKAKNIKSDSSNKFLLINSITNNKCQKSKVLQKKEIYGLEFEPQKWNDKNKFQYSTNCYNYALDLKINPFTGNTFADARITPFFGLQPGGTFSYFPKREDINKEKIIELVKKDAINLEMGIIKADKDTLCPIGGWKVALFLDPGNGYHWYRQNKDGSWSHKRGVGEVTNKDAAGNVIYDPVKCDRNYKKSSYPEFGGYYYVYPLGLPKEK